MGAARGRGRGGAKLAVPRLAPGLPIDPGEFTTKTEGHDTGYLPGQSEDRRAAAVVHFS